MLSLRLIAPIPSHMGSLLLLARLGKTYKRRKEMKQRSDSNRCVTRSAIFVPILERVLTCDFRVMEKLKGEGWAEELEQHPTAYAALKDITGVRVAKPLTDRGTSLTDDLRHLLTTGQLGMDSNLQSSLG